MAQTTIWISGPDGDCEHDPIRGLDYVWRPEVGRRAIAWMEANLKHVKGPNELVGTPIKWSPWQADIFMALYGWRVLGHEHLRRYREAFVEIPRGNGKSTIAAAVGLKGLFGPNVGSPLIIGAATDREQAGIIFGDAASMVRANRRLSDELKVIDSVKRIVRRSQKVSGIGGRFIVLSSEAHRAHGYHPNVIVFDELHAQPNRNLWDVLTTSQINLKDALMFAITTAGYDRQSIAWEVHEQALRACEDRRLAPHLLAAIYAADEGDDIEDPKVQAKANPNIGVAVVGAELKAAINKAKRNPAYMNTVMRLHFNVWTEQDVRAIPMRDWDACAGMVDEPALLRRPCYMGLDLAQVSDLTALALVFPPADRDTGVYDVLMRFYVPESVVRERTDYQIWRDRGLLTVTPGNATDFAFVRADVVRLASKYRVEKLAIDRWMAEWLIGEFKAEGLPVVEFGQGYKSMDPATKGFIRLVLDHRIRHGAHAVLRWNVANLVVTRDPMDNLKPDKSKASEKIDGAVALIMALGVELKYPEDGPGVYVISA